MASLPTEYPLVWLDGQIVPRSRFSLDPADPLLIYGVGFLRPPESYTEHRFIGIVISLACLKLRHLFASRSMNNSFLTPVRLVRLSRAAKSMSHYQNRILKLLANHQPMKCPRLRFGLVKNRVLRQSKRASAFRIRPGTMRWCGAVVV